MYQTQPLPRGMSLNWVYEKIIQKPGASAFLCHTNKHKNEQEQKNKTADFMADFDNRALDADMLLHFRISWPFVIKKG